MSKLDAILSRVSRSHCWIKSDTGPKHLREPLDDEKIKAHLAGHKTYGACPITPGENTTRLALLDLDSHRGETPWDTMKETAREIKKTAALIGLNATAFRSSGGQGIHLIFLWEHPQDAHSVRVALATILESCGLKSGIGGISKSLVEVFPKQNSVAADKFGSMFVLPLNGSKGELLSTDPWALSEPVTTITQEKKDERSPDPGTSTTASSAASLGGIKELLDAIPAGAAELESYEPWRNVAFAIHDATSGSDAGLALFDAFSQRSVDQYSHDAVLAVWASAGKRDAAAVITLGTLRHAARQYGWGQASVEDFDVLPGEPRAVESGTDGADNHAAKPRFADLTLREFTSRSGGSWYVPGVVPVAELFVIFGESSSGKTFFSFDLAAAISRGVEWRGLKCKQARVLYVAAEGQRGLQRRVEAFCLAHNLSLEDLAITIVPAAPDLRKEDDVVALIETVRARGPCGLIFIDTLAQVMAGGDENSSADVGLVLKHCRGLAQKTGAMVVLIHHSGKDATKGARGHSSLRAAADGMIEVTRSGDVRCATVYKQKDGDDGQEMGFKLDVVQLPPDAEGMPVTSCVVNHIDGPVQRPKKRVALGALQMQIMNKLAELELGGAVPYAELFEAVMADTMYDSSNPRGLEHARRHITRAMQSLADGERITTKNGFLSSDRTHESS